MRVKDARQPLGNSLHNSHYATSTSRSWAMVTHFDCLVVEQWLTLIVSLLSSDSLWLSRNWAVTHWLGSPRLFLTRFAETWSDVWKQTIQNQQTLWHLTTPNMLALLRMTWLCRERNENMVIFSLIFINCTDYLYSLYLTVNRQYVPTTPDTTAMYCHPHW